MTTTIDTDGRAVGDTTPTPVLDLQPGDVIQTSWDNSDLAEVLLTTPVTRSPGSVVMVMSGGYVEQAAVDTMYQVVTGERAEQWRADRDAAARRDRFCNQLVDLIDRFRTSDLPMPDRFGRAHLGVNVDTEADVEQAAKALGVEVERSEHSIAAYLPPRDGHDLSVRFQHYQRAEVDA